MSAQRSWHFIPLWQQSYLWAHPSAPAWSEGTPLLDSIWPHVMLPNWVQIEYEPPISPINGGLDCKATSYTNLFCSTYWYLHKHQCMHRVALFRLVVHKTTVTCSLFRVIHLTQASYLISVRLQWQTKSEGLKGIVEMLSVVFNAKVLCSPSDGCMSAKCWRVFHNFCCFPERRASRSVWNPITFHLDLKQTADLSLENVTTKYYRVKGELEIKKN